MILLTVIAASSHKTERVLLRRFPERELTRLFLAGHPELGPGKRSWRVTAAGRAHLKSLRELTKSRAA